VQKITARGINPDKIVFLGFPLRPAFFKQYDAVQLKKKYQLDPAIPVVLISMGAHSSTALVYAVNALKQLPIPVQLIIMLGKSIYLRETLGGNRDAAMDFLHDC